MESASLGNEIKEDRFGTIESHMKSRVHCLICSGFSPGHSLSLETDSVRQALVFSLVTKYVKGEVHLKFDSLMTTTFQDNSPGLKRYRGSPVTQAHLLKSEKNKCLAGLTDISHPMTQCFYSP